MWYWIFRTIFIIIAKLLFRLKVEGVENLPRKTNFIVVANHSSFLDTVIIGAAIPRKIYWVAMRSLYRIFWLRWFFQMIDVLPSGSASERALNLLWRNKNIGLFPEGGLTRDGNLREFRRGAALLASKSGRPIVPCAILGTYQAFPAGAKLPRFVPVKVKIGRPKFILREFGDRIDDVYLQNGIFKIRNTIKEMLYAG